MVFKGLFRLGKAKSQMPEALSPSKAPEPASWLSKLDWAPRGQQSSCPAQLTARLPFSCLSMLLSGMRVSSAESFHLTRPLGHWLWWPEKVSATLPFQPCQMPSGTALLGGSAQMSLLSRGTGGWPSSSCPGFDNAYQWQRSPRSDSH